MFTVVIPAYNCENTIYRALKSIIDQTRFDLIDEIIVIDDGSIDGTGKIIKDFKNKFNVNINYIKQKNRGVSFARNRGILMAKSPWIALLDADDEWFPIKIERQAEVIAQVEGIKFLGSQFPLKFIFKEKKGLVKITAHNLCIRSLPPTPSVVFERNTGISLGLFDVNMKYCEDINFFQRFLRLDGYYVLAEKLVAIDIDKKYHGQKGLSSCYSEMHKSRNFNVRLLYKEGFIGYWYMKVILCFNELKLIRRKLIRFINTIK